MKYILNNKGKGTHGGANPVTTNDLYRLDTIIGNITEIANRSYNDLQDLPTLPTNLSELNNDAGYITGISWNDVTNKPIIPTNNNQLTNGAGYLTSVTWSDVSGKPSIPNQTSDLINDSGFISSVNWSQIIDKPSVFTPAGHQHDASDITTGTIAYARLPISSVNVGNWNTAFSWGDHAFEGYLKSVSWSQIQSKPSTFTPSAHNHDDRYYTETEIDNMIAGVASSGHTHTISQITDFPSIPDSTSDLVNDAGFITGVSWNQVTGKPLTFAPSAHNHDDRYYTETEIDTRLEGYSQTNHTHYVADIIDFPAIPDTTSDLVNDSGFLTSVAWGDITAKPTTFTPSTHNHDDRYYTESEIDAMLNGIAVDNHTHTVSDITDFPVIPDSTSDLINDSDFVTSADIPTVPTNISAFTNDAGYLTSATVPTIDDIIEIPNRSYNDLQDKPSLYQPWYFKVNTGALNVVGSGASLDFKAGANMIITKTSSSITFNADIPEGTDDISASRSLTAADNGKTLVCTGTITITIPAGLGSDFSVNLINDGTGIVTIAGSGVTLKAPHGDKLLADYTANILKRTGAETFYVQGELSE